MTTRRRLLWVFVFGMGLAGHAQAVGQSPQRETWNCGTVALYHLLRLEGRPASFEQVRSGLPTLGPEGYSLLDLRRAAALRGLRLDAVILPKQRSAINGPTLLYTKVNKEGHFVVARPVGHTGKLIQVLDGEREPRVFDADWLFASSSWTGIALVPHRTNYVALSAGCLSATCLVVLGLVTWKRLRLRLPVVALIAASAASDGIVDQSLREPPQAVISAIS